MVGRGSWAGGRKRAGGNGGFSRRVRGRTAGFGGRFTPRTRMAGRYAGFYRKQGFYKFGQRGSPELKFQDFAVNDTTLASAMVNTNISVIAQNVTETGRIGRRCTIRSISIRGSFTLLAATDITNTSNRVRCRLVLDKQTNGADFGATALLDTDAIDSFANLAQKSRFRVLMDKVYTLNSAGGAPSGAAFALSERTVNVNLHMKCAHQIEFNDAFITGVVATQRTNSLHWLTQTATGEIISEAVNIRVRFSDD